MANPDLMKHKNIIDVVKYRPLWLLISAILLIPCIIAIGYLMMTQPNHAPVKLGIDYTGAQFYNIQHLMKFRLMILKI